MRDKAEPLSFEIQERRSGVFAKRDVDEVRWDALDARTGEALFRIAQSPRLALDDGLREATAALARIRVWCADVDFGDPATLSLTPRGDADLRAALSRTYRWSALVAEELAEVAEGDARAGGYPLGAYTEFAVTCFAGELAELGSDLPLLATLRRDVRTLLRVVRQ